MRNSCTFLIKRHCVPDFVRFLAQHQKQKVRKWSQGMSTLPWYHYSEYHDAIKQLSRVNNAFSQEFHFHQQCSRTVNNLKINITPEATVLFQVIHERPTRLNLSALSSDADDTAAIANRQDEPKNNIKYIRFSLFNAVYSVACSPIRRRRSWLVAY